MEGQGDREIATQMMIEISHSLYPSAPSLSLTLKQGSLTVIVLYALIGLVVGGVINLLADVLPSRHKKITTPATCPACGQPRSAIQSLAVVAYLTGKRDLPVVRAADRHSQRDRGTGHGGVICAVVFVLTSIW